MRNLARDTTAGPLGASSQRTPGRALIGAHALPSRPDDVVVNDDGALLRTRSVTGPPSSSSSPACAVPARCVAVNSKRRRRRHAIDRRCRGVRARIARMIAPRRARRRRSAAAPVARAPRARGTTPRSREAAARTAVARLGVAQREPGVRVGAGEHHDAPPLREVVPPAPDVEVRLVAAGRRSFRRTGTDSRPAPSSSLNFGRHPGCFALTRQLVSGLSHSTPSNGASQSPQLQLRLRRIRMRDDAEAAEPLHVLDDVARLRRRADTAPPACRARGSDRRSC